MQINNLEKFMKTIRSSNSVTGMVITLNDPTISELAVDAGFDFTWLYMEHSPLTITDIANYIMALRGTDCAPFVRVPWNESGIIKTVIDLAPVGIIIPMINSADDINPPEGTCVCGLRRAVHYEAKSNSQYCQESQNKPFIVAQIEHIEAVKNLDKILKVKYLGIICIWLNDFSGAMGTFASQNDIEVGKIIDKICVKAHQENIMVGALAECHDLWAHCKFNWVAFTTDAGEAKILSKNIHKINHSQWRPHESEHKSKTSG